MTNRRWLTMLTLLSTATVATAALVQESGRKRDVGIVEPPAQLLRVAERSEKPAPPDRVHLDKLRDRDADPATGDAFGTRGWSKPVPRAPLKPPAAVAVPVAPAAPSPVAPPPSAPALPFSYLGKLLSEEINAVFLALGERNLVVREGEVIESTYRVDQISETQLKFTHLPTGAQQSLFIGEAK